MLDGRESAFLSAADECMSVSYRRRSVGPRILRVKRQSRRRRSEGGLSSFENTFGQLLWGGGGATKRVCREVKSII